MAFKREKGITKELLDKRINLLPDSIITRRKQRKQFSQIVFVLILIIVGISYYMMDYMERTDYLRAESDATLNRISILREQQAKQAIIAGLEEQIAYKQDLLHDVYESNESVSLILGIIEISIPKEIKFNSVSVTSEAEIVITGSGKNYEQVADFVHMLKETQAFDEVFLQTINKTVFRYSLGGKAITTYDFSLICKIGGSEDEV